MEYLTLEQLEQIDVLINQIKNERSSCNMQVEDKRYKLLRDLGWITYKLDSTKKIICVDANPDFSALGERSFKEWYNAQIELNRPHVSIDASTNIHATDSAVVIGNNNTILLNRTIFEDAKKEIEQYNELSSEDKEEFKEIIEDIENVQTHNTKVSKTVLRGLYKFNGLVQFGAALSTIYNTFRSQINAIISSL